MRPFIFIVSAFLLTACSTTSPQNTEPAAAISQPTDNAPEVIASTEPATEAGNYNAVTVDFNQIDGQTPATVQQYLGEPTLVYRDDTVQTMIFESATCVFHIIFYEPKNGDHFRAAYTEARTPGGTPADTETCLRTMLVVR